MIRTILTHLILPPAFQILLGLMGLLLWRFKKGLALLCFAFSFTTLTLFSLPVVTFSLYETLEVYPAVAPSEWAAFEKVPNTVVVILGGGKDQAIEYGGEAISPAALGRVRYGHLVAEATGLPVLVSGGSVYGKGVSEAELMAKVLEEFGHTKVLLERLSKNTWENAKYTAELLKGRGMTDVILVTSAGHMKRSVYSFEQFGFKVVAAPTLFRATLPEGRELLPTTEALLHSAEALREWLGLLVYSFFYEAPSQHHAQNTDEASP